MIVVITNPLQTLPLFVIFLRVLWYFTLFLVAMLILGISWLAVLNHCNTMHFFSVALSCNRSDSFVFIHTQTYTFVVAPCLKTHRHISRTIWQLPDLGIPLWHCTKKPGKVDQKSRQTIVTQKCLSGFYFLSLVLCIDAQIEIDWHHHHQLKLWLLVNDWAQGKIRHIFLSWDLYQTDLFNRNCHASNPWP